MTFKQMIGIVPVFALVLTGLGCGPATPGVQVDSSGSGTVYVDQESGSTITVGNGISIPDDFPSEVPIYANAEVEQAATVANGTESGATLLFTSTDSAVTVSTWYEAQLTASGWVRSAAYTAGGQDTRVFTKGDSTISVTVTADAEGSSTLVVWVPNR